MHCFGAAVMVFRGVQVDEACSQRLQTAVRQRVLELFEVIRRSRERLAHNAGKSPALAVARRDNLHAFLCSPNPAERRWRRLRSRFVLACIIV